MTDTTTALTDEQIEDRAQQWDIVTLRRHTSMLGPEFDRTIAAVITRAKRETAEKIGAKTIYVVQQWVETDGIHDGWNTAYGHFTNSRADAEERLEYLRRTHRDAEFRLVTATRSDWKDATNETR